MAPMKAYLILCAAGSLAAQSSPARGSLVLDGDVGDTRAIDSAFVSLAGGSGSRIVVIPTASIPDPTPPAMTAHLASRMKGTFDVSTLTILHTVNRADADSDSFIEPLRTATP